MKNLRNKFFTVGLIGALSSLTGTAYSNELKREVILTAYKDTFQTWKEMEESELQRKFLICNYWEDGFEGEAKDGYASKKELIGLGKQKFEQGEKITFVYDDPISPKGTRSTLLIFNEKNKVVYSDDVLYIYDENVRMNTINSKGLEIGAYEAGWYLDKKLEDFLMFEVISKKQSDKNEKPKR